MEKWFFSFGVGTLMKDYVVVIEGTFKEAREKMVEVFGREWCAQYSEQDWEEFEKKYGKYKRIEI